MSDRERFWEKVEQENDDECWEWTAYTDSKGYGRFWKDGGQKKAHRVAFGLEKESPEDSFVLHKCDNPTCVNPNHLYLGDYGDNLEDAHARGGLDYKGSKNPNSKLSQDEVNQIRKKLREGMTQENIASEFGVSQKTVSNVKNEVTYNV